VFPTSAWNYGLVLDPRHPVRSFQVVRKDGPVPQQPFTADTVPLRMRAKAKRISGWQMDRNQMIEKLQRSPVKSAEAVEEITLIPLGAARLRLGMFPVIGDGPEAQDWVASSKPQASAYKASASHCFESDTVEALCDGQEPASSNDHDIPRFTWWPHQGGKEWIQYDFAKLKRISRASVYWFDDTPGGRCGLPHSWRLLYQDGKQWREVCGAKVDPITTDTWNTTTFDTVETRALRLEVQLRPTLSGGILKWRVGDGGTAGPQARP
jgi:hypothetical protein